MNLPGPEMVMSVACTILSIVITCVYALKKKAKRSLDDDISEILNNEQFK